VGRDEPSMAEYCRQCAKTLGMDHDTFCTKIRNNAIVCEGCGKTVVNFRGDCTGACGNQSHIGLCTGYLFDTKYPNLLFVELRKYTLKTYLYKTLADTLQWVPRVMFLVAICYLVVISIKMSIVFRSRPNEKLQLAGELAASKADFMFERSLNFWINQEMKLEHLLF